MHRPLTRLLRACLPALPALAGVLALPARASAQCTEEPCGPMDFTPPSVTISPAGGTYAAGNQAVTIHFSDDYVLDHGSRQIVYNGQDVTSAFTYTVTSNWTTQATGTVAVAAGSRTLTASICDASASHNCTAQSVTYTGPAPSVRVSPEADALALPGGTPSASRYRVVNTGTGFTAYAVSTSCSAAGFSSCRASTDSVRLAAGDSTWVDAYFDTPASGTGTVSLTAVAGSASSTGYTSVTALAAPDPGYPGDAASLMRMERGHCLTVSMGPAAASECGALRVVHALPAVRALNRQRTPVLVYNHDLARPNPIVAQHVTPPAGTPPDTIRAVLTVNGVQYRGKWTGWGSNQTRRIAVGFIASGMGTGLVPYHWHVTAEWNGGGSQIVVSENRRMVVVDRSGSPFGAGWWLAGVEQLHHLPGDTLKLWVGGDGSARLYRGPAGSGPWVADGFARPERIVKTTNGGATEYVRTLPGGARVYFNGSGEHVRTVNTLGHATTFSWTGSTTTTRRLEHITLPATTDNPVPPRYTFEYNNNAGTAVPRLSRVVSPGPVDYRYTRVVTDASARVTSIVDPDSSSVGFGYSGATALMTSRTDRRQSQQTFGYNAGRFHTSWVRPHPDSTAVRRILYDMRGRGLPGYASVREDSVLAIWDGGRDDVCDCTWWRLDRWGAPVSMRDVYGQVTTYERGDPRWPAQVTKVTAPNGFTTTASYDHLGYLSSTTAWNPYGDPRNPTTTFRWNDTAAAPTRIVAPEGEVTLMGYDSFGRRTWEQAGPSTARMVSYRYYDAGHARAPGLLRASTVAGTPGDSVVYDARGNLAATVTPMGITVDFENDRLGRTLVTRSPVDGSVFKYDSVFYNVVDQVDSTVTRGGAQRVVVNNSYDPEGNLKAVSRRSSPDPAGIGTITTQWIYDGMGRSIAEIAPDGLRDSTVYDRAGNVVEAHTRRTDSANQRIVVRMRYDALNRLTHRITPPVHYAARDEGLAQRGIDIGQGGSGGTQPPPYPWYPNDGGSGYLVHGDTAVFTYDGMGRMVSAVNRDARVHRSYYDGGALKGDTLIVRTVAELSTGGNFTSHVYGLEFRYDRNGRRAEIKHPSTIAPLQNGVLKDRTTYGYHPHTGALVRVTDPLGTEFRYHYNNRGEVDTLYLPGNIRESYRYDLDGRLALHQTHNASTSQTAYTANPMRRDTLGYDPGGKMRFSSNGAGAQDSAIANYTAMGHLSLSRTRSVGATFNSQLPSSVAEETPVLDALGNQLSRATASSFVMGGYGRTTFSSPELFRYHTGTGRLRAKGVTNVHTDTLVYDGAGNVVWETTTSPGISPSDDFRDRAYFYGADGKLRASDVRDVDNPTTDVGPYTRSFEEYRYDALGRRVLTRALRDCRQTPYSGLCRLGFARRTVWDGDQELFEIQAPESGDVSYYAQYRENDTAHVALLAVTGEGTNIDPNAFYGRVLYTHGLSLDHPLGVVRMGYGDRVDDNGQLAPYRAVEPYVVVPHWNSRGQAVLGTFQDGGARRCVTLNGTPRCIIITWPELWAGFTRPQVRPNAWHGTLLTDKGDASGLNYRRNRYYDPATGRFTQEDPIGLAGGLNLYGFAAGDPVSYSDPYGLKVCAATRQLRQAVTEAVNASQIVWDKNNCVVEGSVKFNAGAEWKESQDLFLRMVASNVTWNIIEDPFSDSQHDRPNLTNWAMNHTIRINPRDVGIGYRADRGGRCVGGVPGAITTLPQIVAHELFGHGGHVVRNRGPFGLPGPMTTNENEAMRWERKYSAAARHPVRCDHAVY